jgi:hypothetical protein
MNNVSFNKNGMSNDYPYEIVPTNKSMDHYKISNECRFISMDEAKKNQCEVYSEIYRCENVERFLDFRAKNRSEYPELKEILELSQLSTENAITGKIIDFDSCKKRSVTLQKKAQEHLGIPESFKANRNVLEKLLTDIWNGDSSPQQVPDEENLFWQFTQIYNLASPGMHGDFHGEKMQAAIKIFREKKLYSQLPEQKRLLWAGAYEAAISLEGQFSTMDRDLKIKTDKKD